MADDNDLLEVIQSPEGQEKVREFNTRAGREPTIEEQKEIARRLLGPSDSIIDSLFGEDQYERFVPSGSWSAANPADWDWVSNYLGDVYSGLSASAIRSRVNKVAEEYATANGTWPTGRELLEQPNTVTYMDNLASGAPFNLPAIFQMDGVTYINDPWSGPVATTTQRRVAAGSKVGAGGNINTRLGPGGIDALLETGELNNSGAFQAPTKIPVLTRQDFQQMLSRGRRGSGSSGTIRQARAYDRDELIEKGTDRWKQIMMEDPADIETDVDAFIKRGQSFWMKQGGNLDFDTFMLNRMRKTGRYKTIYSRKDPHLTEEEYMARYRGTVESFGLNRQATVRETEAGLKSGVGQAGFAERVSRTRESRLANTGRFSQQLASQMAQMGEMG